jgi:hypothetical protein
MGDSMSTIINATTTNGVVIQPDNSGSLVLQTNNGTTALTIDTSQNTTFAKSIILNGSTSGTVTVAAPAVSGTTTLTLPSTSGTVLTSASSLAASQLPAGSVLQVVSTTKTDTFTTTSTSPVDITGLSVSITPSNSSNKILITGSVCYGQSTAIPYLIGFLLVRNSTNICIADAAGSRGRLTFGAQGVYSTDNTVFAPINFLDSPATTSATTYKIQVQAESPQTVYINRGGESDGDVAITGRFTSTITVMEIKG